MLENIKFKRNKQTFKQKNAIVGDYSISYFFKSQTYYVGDATKKIIMQKASELDVYNFLLKVHPEYFL